MTMIPYAIFYGGLVAFALCILAALRFSNPHWFCCRKCACWFNDLGITQVSRPSTDEWEWGVCPDCLERRPPLRAGCDTRDSRQPDSSPSPIGGSGGHP